MSDLISIIIPVYNAENTIKTCVDSILCQTYQNIEIILINDASTDHTAQICEEYARKYSNVHVFHQANAGPSSARNNGISKASGSYIGFVDADDYVEKNMYEFLYTSITASQSQVAVCGWYSHRDGLVFRHGKMPKSQVFSGTDAIYYTIRGGYFDGYLWNKLFDASVFESLLENNQSNKYLNENIFICEDLLLCCEVFTRCRSVFYNPVPLYHYTINSSSAIRSYDRPTRETEMIARQNIIDLLKPIDKKLWRLAQFMYTQSALGILNSAHKFGKLAMKQRMRQESRKYIVPSLLYSKVGIKAKLRLAVMYLAPVISTNTWDHIKNMLGIKPNR